MLITDFGSTRVTVSHRDALTLPEAVLQGLSAHCGPSRPVGGVARWGADQYWDVPNYLMEEFRALVTKLERCRLGSGERGWPGSIPGRLDGN